MNKFKLFALAAFAMLSTNALAADPEPTYVVKGGLIYKVVTEYAKATATAGTVTLEGIANNTNGNAIKTAKAVSVPASFKVVVDDEENTYNVVGTNADWETAAITKPAGQNLSTVIETLTIDITNFSAQLSNDAINGFTKLATLKIIDNTVENPKATPAVVAKTKTLPTIPATVTTLDFENTNITDMTSPYFKSNAKIVTVKLSKAMKVIPVDAFAGASKLKTVVLPTNLETICGGAFQECAALEGTIEIPATVQNIGAKAFYKDAKADFDLSKAAALVNIYNYAFAESGITTANLNASVKLTQIGDWAFSAEKLAKLQMSGLSKGKLAKIGNAAFAFTKITAANIPATVTEIGTYAFAGCEELTTLSKMAGLTAIPEAAFKGDVKLASVSIAKGVASIGVSAFEDCKALATVTIMTDDKDKSDLTTLGATAFKGCEALTSIDLSATGVKTIPSASTFEGCTELAEFIFPEDVTSIAVDAFKDTKIAELDLSKAAIPTVLGTIFGTYTEEAPNTTLKTLKLGNATEVAAFQYFTALETVEMGDGGVNGGAFANCTALKSFTKGTGYVAEKAFENDKALATFTMKDGEVVDNAFLNCTALKTFNYTEPTNQLISVKAFLGCTPFVTINTTAAYVKAYPNITGNTDKVLVPTNAQWGQGAVLKVKETVKDKTGDKYYMYFTNTDATNYAIFNKEDAKMYSIYVDEGVAYFQSVITSGGKYYVGPGEHVILKTDEAKAVEYVLETATKSTVLIDQVFHGDGNPLAAFQANPNTYSYSDGTAVSYTNGKDYVYRLTNNATNGFGFSFYAGTNLNEGQFFIISDKKPASAGARLQSVWLDENGNVEGDATGIQQVDAAEAQDGAIYNLQGVRVNAAKKGLYIQNGKKFIVK